MQIGASETIKSVMDSGSIRVSARTVVSVGHSYDWAVQNSFLSQHMTVSELDFFLPLANDSSVGMTNGLEQILCMPALQCWHGTASSCSIGTNWAAILHLSVVEG